jgi:hypothetical protein
MSRENVCDYLNLAMRLTGPAPSERLAFPAVAGFADKP